MLGNKSLLETAVACNSYEEYVEVRELYLSTGVTVWSWHRGYKIPDDEEEDCNHYGYEPCGFLKHTWKVNSSQLLTIEELREKVKEIVNAE